MLCFKVQPLICRKSYQNYNSLYWVLYIPYITTWENLIKCLVHFPLVLISLILYLRIPGIKPCAYVTWQWGFGSSCYWGGWGQKRLGKAFAIVPTGNYLQYVYIVRKPLRLKVLICTHPCKLILYLFELYCSVCQDVRKLLKKLKRGGLIEG